MEMELGCYSPLAIKAGQKRCTIILDGHSVQLHHLTNPTAVPDNEINS